MKSYASRAQLAVTQAEIDAAMELEWDRRLITVLGSANNRLYEFRLQTANSTYEASKVCCLLFCLQHECCVFPTVLHTESLQLRICIQICVSITMLIILQQTCIGSCMVVYMVLQTLAEMPQVLRIYSDVI